jgi:hypothetical protein
MRRASAADAISRRGFLTRNALALAVGATAGGCPFAAVTRLHERGIIATVTPYAERYVRFAPSMRNLPEEIETVLREVHQLR